MLQCKVGPVLVSSLMFLDIFQVVKTLGGELVENMETCTHLVTDKVRVVLIQFCKKNLTFDKLNLNFWPLG